jgi:hypothetical protein
MSPSAYVLTEEAYLTVLLHAAKYPSCTVCGVLLGQSTAGGVTVNTAVPLFHLSMLLAPCVETALSQVRASASGSEIGVVQSHEVVLWVAL